ncbi:MAG: extracellular solute-binding protein [Clostridiales bacterium]|nr:extracellular solute-binding protein [Clostridiales bacterium]
MNKKLVNLLALSICLSTLTFPACKSNTGGKRGDGIVLRVGSWDEYIDEGGEDSYVEGSNPLYEEFAEYYTEKTGVKVTVEYVPLQDNETMYNKIKMGDTYDLLCPSEYMMMKLKSEGKIQPFPASFFDKANPENHYARNLSPFIEKQFTEGGWYEYIAGYMWGSTGFVFNPEEIGATKEESRTIMSSWSALTNKLCHREITAKDNVRDSYFMGLGLYFENELLNEKQSFLEKEKQFNAGSITQTEYEQAETHYKTVLKNKMNETSDQTVAGVKERLIDMRKNIYGLETDEGKLDVIAGRLNASYQWSGDAVFILDEAESESDLLLEYSVPSSASNLWFDGWVLMNGVEEEKIPIATAFINFLSEPINVVRNMYYIGYTSCISGNPDDEENLVYSYIEETYGYSEESEDLPVEYDLSPYFGEGHILTVPENQTRRQLFAQYPDTETAKRLVVMENFDLKTNEKLNRMWNNIK